MPAIIDAVAVTSRDMARSVAFYTALGFDFAGVDTSGPHVEPKHAPGSARLMIDDHKLIAGLLGAEPAPPNHAAFALLCATPAEVDSLAAAASKAGFTVKAQPFDAPWGQRYATLSDPEGYLVDLFAPL